MKTETDETRVAHSELEQLYYDSTDAKPPGARSLTAPARIAVYSSETGAPEITEVASDTPGELVRTLASSVFEKCVSLGGGFSFDVVYAAIENLVHADFRGVTVSVLQNGNTLKISDRGPGIADKKQALEIGFTTADEKQRETIKGVGSGFALIARRLADRGGSLVLDDNLRGGAVLTLSLPADKKREGRAENDDVCQQALTDRQKKVFFIITELGCVGPSRIAAELSAGLSSAHRDLAVLEGAGLVVCDDQGKRSLTDLGFRSLDTIINS